MTSSTPATTNETIAVSNTPILLNVNMSNVTKLTAINFLMWSRQVHALLDGYDLGGYVDGSVAVPSPTVTIDGVVVANTAYTLWKRQDKLIYSVLLGAISTSIQPLLSKTTTAMEIWTTLSSTYDKPSRGHMKQLKQQIKQWTKGTKSIDEYFEGLTTRSDQLVLLGKAIDHEDKIEFILEGLPDDYKSVVDQIKGRDIPPTLTELLEKLINCEATFLTVVASALISATANAVNFRGPGNNNYRNQNKSNNRNTPT